MIDPIKTAYNRGGASEVVLGTWRTFALEFYSSRIKSVFGEHGLQWYTWMRELESRRYVSSLVSRGIGKDIANVNLDDYKSSDTIFILGSGASINKISDEGWKHIAEHDSFGLNKWPLHDFVPTYYMFELPPGPENQEYRDWYWELLTHKNDSYSEIPVILKDISPDTYYDLESTPVPDWLSDDLILAPSIKIPMGKEQLDSEFENIDRLGYFNTENDIRYLYQSNASIILLILLAVKLGYESIVLCGVDLNHSKYFFDGKQELYSERNTPYPDFLTNRDRNPDDPHKTADETEKQVTVDELVYSINRTVLQPRGISLYTENKESKLYPEVPHYNLDE